MSVSSFGLQRYPSKSETFAHWDYLTELESCTFSRLVRTRGRRSYGFMVSKYKLGRTYPPKSIDEWDFILTWEFGVYMGRFFVDVPHRCWLACNSVFDIWYLNFEARKWHTPCAIAMLRACHTLNTSYFRSVSVCTEIYLKDRAELETWTDDIDQRQSKRMHLS